MAACVIKRDYRRKCAMHTKMSSVISAYDCKRADLMGMMIIELANFTRRRLIFDCRLARDVMALRIAMATNYQSKYYVVCAAAAG